MSTISVSRHKIFPKSVQAGIPKLTPPKHGWVTHKFGDLFEVMQRSIRMDDEQEYELVKVKRSRGGVAKRSTLKGHKISVKNQYTIEENDFLISKRQIVHGACGIVPRCFSGSIVSNEYSVLKCKEQFDLQFVGYLSHTIYFQQTCFHSSVGVHVEKMIFKLDDWFKWPVNLPSLPEQKKIADFLGAVDDKIAGLRERERLLTDYKKGVMQKIFAQDIRFKADDGSDFPEWEAKSFSEISDVLTGFAFRSDDFSESGTNKVIRMSDLKAGRLANANHALVFDDVVDGLVDFKLQEEDFLFGMSGSLSNYAWVKKHNLPAYLNQRVGCLRANGNNSAKFAQYLYLTPQIQNLIERCAVGAAQLNISTTFLKKMKINSPVYEEQQKIADFLSAIDEKITAVSAQISHMQDFKKGLLQQMFV